MALPKLDIAKHGVSREMAGTVLALTALVLYITSQLLFRYSTLSTTYPVINELQLRDTFANIAMAFAIAAIATKPHSLRLWQGILVAITLIILMYSASRTNDYLLVQGCVILIAVAGISLDKLCKSYFLTVIPIIILVMVLALAGLEYNKDVIPNGRLVFSYGFGHPNTTGALLFSAIGAMAFTCWSKPTWKAPFFLAVVSATFSYVSLSSRASAGLLVALALVILVGHLPKVSRVNNVPRKAHIAILVAIPLCLLGLMLVCTAFYNADNPLFAWLNKLVHGRPYFAHEYYVNHHGFTHLGSKYASISSYHTGLPFTSVDSGYSRLAMVYGLFSMYALITAYLISVWKTATHQKRFFIMCIFLLNAAYLLIESVPLSVAASFGVLFLSQTFADDGPTENGHEEHASRAKHNKASKEIGSGKGERILVYVLGVALLVVMALAAMYGFKYGVVDESTAVGNVAIEKDGKTVFAMNVDRDMNAFVTYREYRVMGALKLAGADEDSVLFQLEEAICFGVHDPTDVVLFVRMPRSGLQEDFAGLWEVYFSYPPDKVKCSDWVFALEDGRAKVGAAKKINAVTAQRSRLLEKASSYTWEKQGARLLLTSAT